MKNILFLALAATLALASCKKEDVPGSRDYKTLGTAAKDLLTATPYTTLRIEVSYMPGYEPPAEALNQLRSFFDTYLNKPGGITLTRQQIAASGKSQLTLKEIVALEKANRTVFTAGNTLAVHVLVVDADYDQARILGTSYWNTSFCIFGKTMNAYSGGIGQIGRTALYSALMQHEAGHLLGLVDQGSPMVAPHKENGAHCTDNRCLMHHQLETGASAALNVPSLDVNCKNDLKANGGK